MTRKKFDMTTIIDTVKMAIVYLLMASALVMAGVTAFGQTYTDQNKVLYAKYMDAINEYNNFIITDSVLAHQDRMDALGSPLLEYRDSLVYLRPLVKYERQYLKESRKWVFQDEDHRMRWVTLHATGKVLRKKNRVFNMRHPRFRKWAKIEAPVYYF
jgi:hypothetical protein